MNNGYYGQRAYPLEEAIYYAKRLQQEVADWSGRIESALGEASPGVETTVRNFLARAGDMAHDVEALLWGDNQRMRDEAAARE